MGKIATVRSTGQHLLSAVVDEIVGADTISWEMHPLRDDQEPSASTASIELPSPALSHQQLQVAASACRLPDAQRVPCYLPESTGVNDFSLHLSGNILFWTSVACYMQLNASAPVLPRLTGAVMIFGPRLAQSPCNITTLNGRLFPLLLDRTQACMLGLMQLGCPAL